MAIEDPKPSTTSRITVYALIAVLVASIPLGLLIGTYANGATVRPTPTLPPQTAYASSAKITFTRPTKDVGVPSATVVASESNGQIPATILNVNVAQISSDPIVAPFDGTNYYVPDGCGNVSPAYAAARDSIQFHLNSQTPGGTVTFYGPVYGYGGVSCQPAPGTTSPNPFVYVEQISANGSHSYYHVIDAQNYQLAQLKKAVPQNYDLIAANLCHGTLDMSNKSRTSVTLNCPASGTAGWEWKSATQQTLAQSLAGLTPAAAKTFLSKTPGINADSITITLADGEALPKDPKAISFDIQPIDNLS